MNPIPKYEAGEAVHFYYTAEDELYLILKVNILEKEYYMLHIKSSDHQYINIDFVDSFTRAI